MTEDRQGPGKKDRISQTQVKDITTRFWKYLQKDSKDTFLDADMKNVTRGVLNFLNQDLVGQKIVLLEDEKLRTANIVARGLKRKRRIIKTAQQKSTIAKLKRIYKYLNNPFWQKSSMVGKSRKYLDAHLRKMTPVIIQGLTANVEKLQAYFNGIVLDRKIFTSDRGLGQIALDHSFGQFAVCEKHQQALVIDETQHVICIFTDCVTGRCPFEADKAHGEEAVFLSDLKELLKRKGIIGDEKKGGD